MRYILAFLLCSITINLNAQSQPDMNVIYGDKHIFTIITPDGWINDKESAAKIGLVSFFYSKEDIKKNPRSHFYAIGYDKNEKDHDLKSFMTGDIANFKKKYPELKYEQIEIGRSEGIVDGKLLSYSNLKDRFREEVLYLETEFSILVFVFSAFSEADYQNYLPIFDQFLASFNYRGSNPKPFLEWQSKQGDN